MIEKIFNCWSKVFCLGTVFVTGLCTSMAFLLCFKSFQNRDAAILLELCS